LVFSYWLISVYYGLVAKGLSVQVNRTRMASVCIVSVSRYACEIEYFQEFAKSISCLLSFFVFPALSSFSCTA